MEKEKKAMSADEIRKQLNITKAAIANYLALGVLTPVPGTADNDTPLYYVDEVAAISEALKTCDYNIKRLNFMTGQVKRELLKTKYASCLLELNAAVQDKVTTDFIDAVALFMDKAFPKLNRCSSPFYAMHWNDSSWFNETVSRFKNGNGGRNHSSPQEFCEDLRHEVEVIDTTSLLNCVKERDALIEERDKLKEQIEELKHKIDLASPETLEHLSRNGYRYELTEKQIKGLKLDIFECGFSTRVLNCLNGQLHWPHEDNERLLAHFVKFPLSSVKNFRNLGRRSIKELTDKLAEYDLTFGMDIVEINGKYYCK
jgi:hypothetical protein